MSCRLYVVFYICEPVSSVVIELSLIVANLSFDNDALYDDYFTVSIMLVS